MELKIYDKQGIVKMTVSPDNSSQWNHEVGVENVVTVNFTTWEFLVLEVGWYILVEGHRFSIKTEYRPKHIHNSKYTYNLKFYGREHDTQDILFCRMNQGEDDLESVFAYDGTPMDFLIKVVANMNRNSDGVVWKAGEAITANRQTINFNGLYCWDALGEIARIFGTEWWMDGEYVNLSKCIRGESVSLGYGEGLKSGLTQNENTNSVKWFTRLIPVGSTKNIDKNKYGYTNLQLPGREKYIDINTQYGLKEYREEAAFSEIYPHRVGTISSVRSEERTNEETRNYTVYYVKDSELPFNPDDYMIGGEVIHMTFNSGALAGKEFEVNWDNETGEFEIINQYPDENTQLPGSNLIPSEGDAYVLSNISMPDEYNTAAEKEYKEAVDAYLAEYSKDVSIYSGNTDYIYVAKNNVPLLLGQRIRLLSDQYFDEGSRESRITRVSRKLNNLGDASIDCSNAIASSWKSSVDSSLNQLQFSVAKELAESVIDILKTSDIGNPSDYNVLSALRSLNTFLRKDKDDTSRGLVTFLKGLVAEGLVKADAGATVGETIDSMNAGKGTLITPDGRVQTDRMEVRGSALIREIIYNRLSAQEGDTSYSENGLVEEVTLEEDGTYTLKLQKRWEGDFIVLKEGDILYGDVNNLFASGEYYTSWTRVLSVNPTANTVSVVMYGDKEVPGGVNHAPEPLMRVVKRGNAIDTKRQSYWYLSATTEKCFIWLEGVDKPILDENNYYIMIGRPKNLSIFDNLPINYEHSYIYARGAIIQDLFRVDFHGSEMKRENPRGFWSIEEATNNPYANIDDYYDTVSHYGCEWKCLVTGTLQEPKYGSSDWAMLRGNPLFTIDIDSTRGWFFDVETFATTLFITGRLYNQDVTDSILDGDCSWTRDTGNVAEDNAWSVKRADAGKSIDLTLDDLGANYPMLTGCKFKCTALLRDGQQVEIAENYVIF